MLFCSWLTSLMRRLSPSANSRRLRRSSRPFTALVRGVETLESRQLLSASPAGSEFMVNTTTAENQSVFSELGGATAMDADGDFVVVWSSFLQDGSGYGVYAQRYNRAGLAQGGEFLVNTTTANNQ
ncbi:MAG: hypothetical protein H7062_20375, partial [Candidatus Saccharimonas sp.]|nr:hypothetical protein [Planctomycetaceae bacterium]